MVDAKRCTLMDLFFPAVSASACNMPVSSTYKSMMISVQDIAGIECSLGEIKNTKVSYEGATNEALAAPLAMHDLLQLSSTLAKITLVANRTAASLNIGDVFRFS